VRDLFTATEVTQTRKQDDTITWSGTYTYNDTHITITTNYRIEALQDLEIYPNPFIFPYRFENDILFMGSPMSTFTKVSN